MINKDIDFKNPTLVRKLGIDALTRELGNVGTICFLRQFEEGYGNYTAERESLLEGITMDEVIKSTREIEKQHKV